MDAGPVDLDRGAKKWSRTKTFAAKTETENTQPVQLVIKPLMTRRKINLGSDPSKSAKILQAGRPDGFANTCPKCDPTHRYFV
jgi:hypothetical protein